jgi:cytochrome c peroxidase
MAICSGFRSVYDDLSRPITADNISKAVAIFERGVVSGPAPFDKWIDGDESAISKRAKDGFVLFNTKARCVQCHSGWNFSDGSFHDIGLKSADIGRGKFLARLKTQQHAFKTPGLRNIAHRGPYMHAGSEQTLTDVIEFYNRGGDAKRESLSSLIKPLKLTKSEVKSLVEFLNTLTGDDPKQTFPVLPR